MTRRLSGLLGLLALAVLGWPLPAALPQGQVLWVNGVDPTCGGRAPCYTSIQAAVNAALVGDTVRLQAGTYHEQVRIRGKNNTPSASEADRIVLEADPATPGGVILQGTVNQCKRGFAIRVQQSKFVTIRGLTITGAGGPAIALLGGNNQNQAIHIERNRIAGNGSTECDGGITIARGNPDTLVVNNLIYGNRRNGLATIDADGGPHWIVHNTIHENGWNGVSIARAHEVFLVNNAITDNGAQPGSSGGRFGVESEASTARSPVGIHLLNNLVCGNRLGEIDGPALDGTDAGNLTPTGAEGPGVTARPTCADRAAVYTHVAGTDSLPNTLDDDFELVTSSPALDSGLDPRTLGLGPAVDPLLTADFAGEAARPRNATGLPSARFDIGAFERAVADAGAPAVAFIQPGTNAFVRQTVIVEAQATDAGSGVASVTLRADAQPLAPMLEPALPPPAASITAIAPWDTTPLVDGAHTLTATATDAAGNSASATRAVLVDNTPPDTWLTGGPADEIAEASATFTFAGTDNLTADASLVFAWRLDGGAFTAFSASTTVTLTGLAEGPHTFEVAARDLAGNDDATPAGQSFTVRLGPTVASVDPAGGPLGIFVTISGERFEPGATTVAFNGVAAIIRTISATTITTTVPIGASSGPLTVSTPRGIASVPFAVAATGDSALSVVPAQVSVVQGSSIALRVSVGTTGNATGLATLATGPLPAGVTAVFTPAALAPNATGILTLATTGATPPGSNVVEVRAAVPLDGQSILRTAVTTLDVQAPGQTLLGGQVRDQDDLPLAGVRLVLGGSALTTLGTTDEGGNFLVPLAVSGPQVILIDGSALNSASAFYPTVPVTVNIQAGVVNTPGYLPKLRAIPAARLTPIVPGQETVLTDPDLPGFTMTIASGVQIIGWDGQPNTRVGVTAVPLDRSPLPPPPSGVTARYHYLFSFGKLGGGTPTGPVVIDPPNDFGLLPGAQVELWYFDEAPDASAPNRWEQYGTATVSADGTKILADVDPATGQRYGMPRFCCGGMMIRVPATAESTAGGGPSGGPTGGGAMAAEPVDTATGFLYVEKTDLDLPARIPLVIRRTYRSGLTNLGPFGLGTSWPYDVFLLPPPGGSPETLVLFTPGNHQDLFVRQPDATFANTTAPALRGAVVTASADGRSLRFKDGRRWVFDAAGRLIGRSDRNGNTVTLARDGQGRVTTITAPDGRQLLLTYSSSNLRIDTITDPLSRIVRYTYDGEGRLEAVTDPAGGVTRYTYDTGHRLLTIIDPRGITFLTNEYDANGRVIRQTQADGGVWTLAYTTVGTAVLATVVTDPRGHTTIYRFNPAGYLVSQTDALGQTTTFTREPWTNLVLAVTDPLGRVTGQTYDLQGNVTTITDPAGHVRTFTYEPTFNRVTSIRDSLGNATAFEYDAAGNLTTVVDPLGDRTTVTYNTFGEPVTIIDPLGSTTTFGYDATGALATVTDPVGNLTRRSYDVVSRLIAQTDPRGYSTRFIYDALNRLTEIVDPLGGLTHFGYDGNGNLLTITDTRGNTTSHTYDTMDRLATRTDPVGATESFRYDELGNLLQHTDRKGQVASFAHDALNRRTDSLYADAARRFVYDAVGRLLEVDDSAGGTVVNQYDALDRLTAQTQTLGTIAYRYDALGRRIQMQAPGVAPVTYAYDAASRLRTITQAPLSPVDIEYDAAGRRTLLTLPNGVSTEYQYDAAARLTALVYRDTLGPLGELMYHYDPAGSRVRIGGSFARTGLPQPVASATYDPANRQLTFGAQSLTHDGNGNLTGDAVATYSWNARNQLTGITGPVTGSFGYDGLGRRVRRTISGATTEFLHDGLTPVQEIIGTGTANLLTGLGIDEYFARTDPAGTLTSLTDALGSTLALSDAAGTTRTQYTYEAFGNVAAAGAISTNPFQYTGRENDGTGLYYYRARYYHPVRGRFSSEDPMYSPGFGHSKCGREIAPRASRYVEVDPGLVPLLALGLWQYATAVSVNPQRLHLYAYTHNSPVNKTDPTGLRAGPQIPGCDLIPDLNRCMTECCNEHDRCYRNAPFSRCDISSWKDFFRRPTRARVDCMDCNIAAVRCIARSVTPGGRKPCP